MPGSAAAFALVSLISAAAVARTEDRDVPPFSAVEVEGGIHATVDVGPRRPVRIEADDDVLALLETRVEHGALRIGFKPHSRRRGDHRVSVTIQTPDLRSVGASGGSVVRASFTRADESGINASGGSELRIRGVDATRLSVDGSGGSVLDIQGRADTLDLQMSGGSHLHGRDLSVKDVDLQASGGSEGELRANGRIRGSLSGGSELHVRGGARAKVATSGGSSVAVED
jgi:hypothetical protein